MLGNFSLLLVITQQYDEEPTVIQYYVYYRFSPANQQNINPFNYVPFGFGPRQCIGMHLALMEIKLAMVKLIQKFRFKDAGVSIFTK